MKTEKEGRPPVGIARELFELPANRRGREPQVQGLLEELLRALGADVEAGNWTEAGPADLYLPRRRVLIEAKKRGDPSMQAPHRDQGRGDGESAFGQLERYMQAEIRNELRIPDLDADDEGRDRDWTGVLTDGRSWWSWRWPHAEGGHAREAWRGRSAAGPEGVIRLAKELADAKPIGKPRIPADPMALFEGFRERLREVRDRRSGRNAHALETKFRLWLDMLRASGMAPEGRDQQGDLFVRHCMLVAIARGVVHTVSHPGTAPDPQEILGEGFVAWIPETEAGRLWARELLGEIHRHEWQLDRTDVLRRIYQDIIQREDRKVFGEYYTPDWLARMLAESVLDPEWRERSAEAALQASRSGAPLHGIGVLDPTCGSGTFLYHAALLLQETDAMRRERRPARRADAVCRLVHGLDIHPVAAELARATLRRALPASPTDGEDSLRVRQGDALLISKSESLEAKGDRFQIETPKGSLINVPKEALKEPDSTSDIRRIVEAAQEPEGSPGSALPLDLAARPYAGKLEEMLRETRKVIEEEGNSVWGWFIVNVASPLTLSETKVDRILANPPWVRMNEIQDRERKRTLEDFAGKPRPRGRPAAAETLRPPPWNGGNQATAFDIAQLFVIRCREKYLAAPKENPAGWLVNATATKGGNWESFRRWQKDLDLVDQALDFSDLRQPPFTGAPCVAFLEGCAHAAAEPERDNTRPAHLLVKAADAKKPVLRDHSMAEATARMRWEKAPPGILQKMSPYLGRFRNGATIFPQNMVTVEVLSDDGYQARVKTLPPPPEPRGLGEILAPGPGPCQRHG